MLSKVHADAVYEMAHSHRLRPNWPTIIAIATLASVVTGCQAPSRRPLQSLDEARRVTVEFAQADASVPPRSIDDILTLLDSAPASQEVAAAHRKAAATPPDTTSNGALAAFYYDRSEASKLVGLDGQALSDARLAYDYGVKAYGPRAAEPRGNRNFVLNLAAREVGTGEPQRGLALMREMLLHATDAHERSVQTCLLVTNLAGAGHVWEAEATLEKCRAALAADPKPTEYSRYIAERAPATVYAAAGDSAQAELHYRRILAMRGKVRASKDTLIREELAEALLHGGDPLAAEVEARQAVRSGVRDTGVDSDWTATAVRVLGESLSAQGRLDDATRLLQRALAIQTRAARGNAAQNLLAVHLALAEVMLAQRRWTEARQHFDAVTAAGHGGDTWMQAALDNSAYPLALIKTGDIDLALSVTETLHRRVSTNAGSGSQAALEAQLYRAIALGEKGALAQALDLFRTLLPAWVAQLRRGGVGNVAAARRLDTYVDYYLKFLFLAGGAQNAAAAFEVADLARGRAVQTALMAGAARASLPDPQLADLARREQDAGQQISALYGQLAQHGADPIVGADLRNRVEQLRDARATLRAEIERRFPDYAALTDPPPASVDSVRAQLAPDEAMIAIFSGESQSYVWAIPQSGPIAFAAVPLGAAGTAETVAALRQALNPNAARLGDIPPFDVAAAHALFRRFLQPVEGGWQGARSLVVVPHGPLAQLPLTLLVTQPATLDPNARPLFAGYRRVAWLARSHAVVSVPSVASFMALRRMPPGKPVRLPLAAFGDPLFRSQPPAPASPVATDPTLEARGLPVALRASPSTRSANRAQLDALPPLPDTAEEVREIAAALTADPTDSVFTGAAASETQVKSMPLADRRVLVFATHGLVPGDLDGLTQPALALASPSASHTDGDGLLSMGEVLGLKLDADWVVLSACNSAAAEGGGSEAISGLGRAFFYAGARALLVSHWPVETRSARLLTAGTFRQQAEDGRLSKAAALQRSMLAVIDGPGLTVGDKTVASYAHPIFWAPFSLVGDGR